jgi:hypothetical protein
LGYTNSGKDKKRIKESIYRLALTGIQSNTAFYYKGTKEYLNETFHLFEHFIERGKKRFDGSIADTNYLKISPIILKSLKANYIKPLDFDYYIGLKSLNAKALYSKLSLDFYGLPEDCNYLQKKYSELCKETLITQQKYKSLAKNYLKNALDELINSNFLKKVEFKDIDKDSSDFYIRFYPGKRAKRPKDFIEYLPENVELFEPKKIECREIPQQQEPKPLVKNLNKTRVKTENIQSDLIRDVVESLEDQLSEEDVFILNALISIGVSKPKAEECTKEHPEKSKYWIEAKKHYTQKHNVRDWPAFIYRAITQGWKSGPYEDYLKKEKTKQKQLEESHRREKEKLLQEDREKQELQKLEAYYNALPKKERNIIDAKAFKMLQKEHPHLCKNKLGIAAKQILNSYVLHFIKQAKV